MNNKYFKILFSFAENPRLQSGVEGEVRTPAKPKAKAFGRSRVWLRRNEPSEESFRIPHNLLWGGSLIFCIIFFFSVSVFASLDLDRLPEKDVKKVKNLLVKLQPLIEERQQKKNLATLTFSELYGPLDKEEIKFLKDFKNLSAKKLNIKIPFRGMATGKEELIIIKGQRVKIKGQVTELAPQFLPADVYKSYTAMMDAMKKDLGKRLYVESGYRSSAYQLYLFIFYLKNHDYSIRETVKFVALPGYSEHGSVRHQAIDFINEDGINGEDNPKEFEDLPEYEWLLKNAGRFGFVISYPKDAKDGITYEPWHWRYEK